ncbi:putative RNA recognition motif containing protein [Lyophyllum shimeji]|uniref:RNA recognition motif containing protein n=1 Tax=Lyophyllum shimeji TaxID=47721 RepID=A0A9P3UU43_LYOSH|nr:putative RNA recognition motif containing protein [Lyophyllum shimeji]
MSRLLIKNLPAYATPARLRAHFEQNGAPGGTLTDVKVAMKPDGTSRRFGFVGYKTEKEALQAKEWFDRTFIDSTRISVTVVEGAKDAPPPRPNKRPRLGPSPADNDAEEPSTKTAKQASDPKKKQKQKPDAAELEEQYMKVMQPRTKKARTWANEEQPEPAAVPIPEQEPEPEVAEGDVAMRDETSAAKDEAVSDLEWMKQRMSKTVDVVERAFEQSDDEDESGTRPLKSTEKEQEAVEPEAQKDPTIETILETARLFVRNLAFSCTEEDLVELFQPFGAISQVHIPVDLNTKHPKGVAYVTFARASDAVAAYAALDKKSFQGRLLHILGAVDRRSKVEDGEGKKRTVKEDKMAKRKAGAAKEFNWSMLYMNADAVASSVADRLNIPKSSILNPDSESSASASGGADAAVKLALAETHIIAETKSFLASHGVSLSAFALTPPRPRSDTIVLVKNIPYGTAEPDIRALFEPHGALVRVLVPPAGTMAVVEFRHAEEARAAWRAVAYRRLGNSVVYLEKGPVGMFDGPDEDQGGSRPAASVPAVKIAEEEGEGDGEEEEEAVTGGAGTTLYVKNLAFSTTQERLAQVFRHLPAFAFARVQTKPDPKRPSGPRLSMGYGFVGFRDKEAAGRAMGSMQGFVLDGHKLVVKFAGRGAEDEGEAKKGKDGAGKGVGGKKTTKMIVKNVPFEATKKDIQALFGAHGHLKSVRLPKKFDSRTRGFAFLDFVSRAEAENAYAALRHTHLLGRHLVLEWAQEDAEQDVDALRRKAGAGYGDGKLVPGRKRKLDMGKTGEEDAEALEV